MWSNNWLKCYTFIFISIFLFSCKKELTPCECGRNLSQPFDKIDQDLEVKCEEYLLKLSYNERRIWNKKVLDSTSDK